MADKLEFEMDGNASGAIQQITQYISALERANTTTSGATSTIRNALNSINSVSLRNKFLGDLPTESRTATTALQGTRQALQGVAGTRVSGDPLGSLPEDARQAQTEVARLRREMQQLQSSRIGNLFGGVNPAPLNGASGALAQLRGNIASTSASMIPFSGQVSALGAGLAPAAILGVGAAIVGVGAAAIGAAAQVQTYKASLTTIVGDADRAGVAFQALARFAQETPFSLDQAVDGFVKLKALGLTPSEAALTSYGNTAAAMGKDLSQMIEAVADASTGEFERLKEFGIKSKQEGDKVKFTFQGVTTTVGKNSAEIEKYLQDIGNNQFAGAMARQTDTIAGAFAGLKDQIFLAFAAIGEGSFADSITTIIDGMTSGLAAATPLLQGIGAIFGGLIDIAVELGSGIVSMFQAFSGGEESLSILDALAIQWNLLGETASVVASLIGSAFSAINGVIKSVVDFVRGLFGDLFDWLGVSSKQSTQTMQQSFFGVLRAVKSVALDIPKLFKAAFASVSGIFREIGSRIASFLSGNFSAFDGVGAALQAQMNIASNAIKETATEAAKIYKDARANQAAMDRMTGRNKGKGASLDSVAGGAVKPTGNSGSGASDAASKKQKAADDAAKKAKKEAADAAKKYDDTIRALNDSILQLGEAEEEKAIRDALVRAGLPRDIDLHDQKAAAIVKLVKALQAGQQAKGMRDELTALEQKYSDMRLTEEDLFVVEARRRAGIKDGQDANTAEIKAFDDKTRAIYRQIEALKSVDKLKQLDKNIGQEEQDTKLQLLEKVNPNQAQQQRDVAQVQQRAQALRDEAKASGASNEEIQKRIERINALEQAQLDNVSITAQLDQADQLQSILTDVWNDPEAAMKSFFSNFLQNIAKAIIQSIILGDKMKGMGGGGIGDILTNAFTGALGLGGGISGRAGGGSVNRGTAYMVGERGRELFVPNSAGRIINNRDLGGMGGGGVSVGGTSINIYGSANDNTAQQMKSQLDAYKRDLRSEIRRELDRSKRIG
ncbi:tape measure protein [Sphingobium chungangianum]